MHWVTVAVVLGLSQLDSVHSTSHDDDNCEKNPENCNFGSDFCGWDKQNWTRNKQEDYAFLKNSKLSGSIKSKVRCVSLPITHCLKFRFYLQKSYKNTLSISIMWPRNQELLLWSYSTNTSWINARVPVETDSSFALIIRARRQHSGGNRHIRVDSIDYKTNQKPCTVLPRSAEPPRATTTEPPTTSARKVTTTTTTVTTATTTTATTTKEISTDRRTHFTTSFTTTSPATSTSVNASVFSRSTDDVTSDTTGTIVGVVVAVIVVAVIATILFLVLRRKHTPLLVMCSTKTKTNTQQSGSHNKAFHSEEKHNPEINSASKTPMYTNCTADSASSVNTELSTNDYSVIGDVGTDDVTSSAFQPMTSLYCKAQVLHSMHEVNRDSENQVSSTDANPYDVVDEEVCQARVSSQEVEYKNPTIDKSHETGASSQSLEIQLRFNFPAQQFAGGASVYEPLQEQKDVHVYSQVPGVYQN